MKLIVWLEVTVELTGRPEMLHFQFPETIIFLQFPRSKEEWKDVAKVFEKRCNFPHCLGAMDGKHISIFLPNGCGSEYFNYKNHHSMVLLAIVDGN